jgi:hypothetical protein
MMKKNFQMVIKSLMVVGVVVFLAVCLHSVEEIHYLKSFFPEKFSVEEAFYASAVELIKILIIGLPILLAIVVGRIIIRNSDGDS